MAGQMQYARMHVTVKDQETKHINFIIKFVLAPRLCGHYTVDRVNIAVGQRLSVTPKISTWLLSIIDISHVHTTLTYLDHGRCTLPHSLDYLGSIDTNGAIPFISA